MPAKLAEIDQMTIEEFLAFTEARPDGEIWELIEGVAVMNASPTEWHQTICGNILYCFMDHKIRTLAPWLPMIGVGTRVPISPRSLPRPDVFVKEGSATDSHATDDAVVIVEVLSRSNGPKDRAWRKRVYGSVPNCQHYVTVSTTLAEIVRHDRSSRWEGISVTGLDAELALPAIDVTIPLREIYRWTPIK